MAHRQIEEDWGRFFCCDVYTAQQRWGSRGCLQGPRDNFVVDPIVLFPQLGEKRLNVSDQSALFKLYQNAGCSDGREAEYAPSQFSAFLFVN